MRACAASLFRKPSAARAPRLRPAFPLASRTASTNSSTRSQQELADGYRRIKMKIKPGWDLDVVRQVRARFPDTLLMVDANSAYSLADVALFQKMDELDLMMIEQPLHYQDMWDHAKLQKEIRTPVCLDESIHSVEDARRAIEMEATRIINIKAGRVGGLSSARAIQKLAEDHDIPVWCGGMLESGIGRAHNVHLSTLSNFTLPGDVADSKRYFVEELIEPRVEVRSDGTIEVPTGPGIGYEIQEDRIEKTPNLEASVDAVAEIGIRHSGQTAPCRSGIRCVRSTIVPVRRVASTKGATCLEGRTPSPSSNVMHGTARCGPNAMPNAGCRSVRARYNSASWDSVIALRGRFS